MVTINVTQDDIDHGLQGDCHECPVARALMFAYNLEHRDQVSVPGDNGGMELRFGKRTKVPKYYPDEEQHYRYEAFVRLPMPSEVNTFIHRFDAAISDEETAKIKPFSFELPELPEWGKSQ